MSPVLSGSDEISESPQSFTTFLLLIFYPTQSLCCLGSISRLYPIRGRAEPFKTWSCCTFPVAKAAHVSQHLNELRFPRVTDDLSFSQIIWQEARLVSDGNLHQDNFKENKEKELFSQNTIFSKNWCFSTRACFTWKFIVSKNYMKNWMEPKCQDTISSLSVKFNVIVKKKKKQTQKLADILFVLNYWFIINLPYSK